MGLKQGKSDLRIFCCIFESKEQHRWLVGIEDIPLLSILYSNTLDNVTRIDVTSDMPKIHIMQFNKNVLAPHPLSVIVVKCSLL